MILTNEKKDKLAIVLVFIFFVLLVAVDVFAPRFVQYYTALRSIKSKALFFYITIYLSSVFGYFCLYKMYRLINNIKNDIVFSNENIGYMKSISLCCFCVFVILIISSFYYLPFVLVAFAAIFLMLIVEIVISAFVKACEMKEELDLTI